MKIKQSFELEILSDINDRDTWNILYEGSYIGCIFIDGNFMRCYVNKDAEIEIGYLRKPEIVQPRHLLSLAECIIPYLLGKDN